MESSVPGVPLELRGLGRIRRTGLRAISAVALARFRLRLGDRLRVGHGVVTGHRIDIRGPGRVEVGDDANMYAFVGRTRLYTRSPEARIAVGRNVRLNGTTIQASRSVVIGNDCILGDANLMDTDMHPLSVDRRHNPEAEVRTAPIVLERNVWVGGQAAVLPGVRIGENSVVGFRAVVTGDVPPNVVVAGNPARVVRSL